MLANLRSNWLSIRASYWFYPALFALGGLVLALVLIHLDRIGAAQWLSRSHWVVPAQPDGATNILTVLSGSMIGVASTVFSITIAAVAYASGNYGPRLLTNFMEDKGNQFSLAMFIGTFVYAITVLRAVRGGDEAPAAIPFAVASGGGFVPQLALLVAFVLMIASVGVLVYFLHHIPASIRINTVLENIGARLLREIEHRFPEEGETDPPVRAVARGDYVRAHRTGYVRLIEMGALVECARKNDVSLSLEVRPGDFVYPGIAIARTDATPLPDDVADSVRESFAFGSSRTPEMDLEFSIDELVEIALRALSPGINDAFTAITATHWLGAATAELGRRNLDVEKWNPIGAACPVATPVNDFDHFLQRGFAAVRSGLATNRLAALVALESLAVAAGQVRGSHRRALLEREVDLLVEQAEEHLTGPDIADVRQRHAAIRAGWA
ncbi:DUF2254 domain-containing protein [Novosphingobium malaysiense]|uniref:DUF2254 domain-containing protein n=1 Tax=Novosphingobium malaysiense TaxID=1348853 RepID=A0A0B1ZST1_9SPHN|nr:DUF2254 domain-containing protein [Novosphingobium malaysiense]KHK92554.1 hypothetical protein LK12_07180 [Novosphingobium malaysiense]